MKLRLVTYNIHKGVGADRHLDLARIAEVVNHHRPDIVCLQEVLWAPVAEGHATQPKKLYDAIGLEHAIVGLNCTRRMGTYGNMTLSRFPIAEHENIDLTLVFQKPRAMLYTRFDLPHATLHLFNAHLGLSAFERRLQTREMAEEVLRLAQGHDAVIVAGDLNDWRHLLFTQVLEAHGFRCAAGHAGDPGHATYPSWFPVGALDKVFVRGAVKRARASPSRLALARVASDHLPLVADIEIDLR
jgi:endonuclease/exonuclease/phosphatase family metal-dependent hydrolase